MADKLTIGLQVMRSAVTEWGEGAKHLKAAADTTAKLEITASQSGTFADAVKKYQPAPGYFRDRLNEGAAVFEDIAAALKYACDAYEYEDLNSKGKLGKLEEEI